MASLVYLSAPYSSPDPAVRDERAECCRRTMASLIEAGKLVICPIVMNHAPIMLLAGRRVRTSGAYWRELEVRLAAACDELVVLQLAGWEDSRGVTREIALFEEMGKPITFLSSNGEGEAHQQEAANSHFDGGPK